MIKSQLITRLAERYPHLYQSDVEKLVARLFAEITMALAEERRVELRGFGTFTARTRPARLGRNPRTGVAVKIGKKRVAHFRSGKALRERVNNKEGERVNTAGGAANKNAGGAANKSKQIL